MANQRDFDKAAVTWDEKPQRIKLSNDILTALAAYLPLSKEWDVVELGCGTGLVALGLAPHVGSVAAVDGSAGMLAKLNEKITALGVANVHTRRLDLEHGELPQGPFHLIVAAMLLHHIPDVAQLLASLRRIVQPGGWIALADLDAEDGSFHEDATGVFHHGFSSQQMVMLLAEAGFVSPAAAVVSEIVRGERRYPVLLTVARTRCVDE